MIRENEEINKLLSIWLEKEKDKWIIRYIILGYIVREKER